MTLFRTIAPLIINPTTKHTASVIFLHGRGDTGEGVRDWLGHVGFTPLNHVKYIFPTAPIMPYTLAGGEAMPCWFDCTASLPRRVEKESDVAKAAQFIDELVSDEMKLGIPSNRVIIGGFSQGGAMALFWLMTRSNPIAGIIALSTWLPCIGKFPADFKGEPTNHCYIGHGTEDPLISLTWARNSHELIKTQFPNTIYKIYQGLDHQLDHDEIDDVQAFISSRIP